MKTKDSNNSRYSKQEQDFIAQHNADTLSLVEMICVTIVLVTLFRWLGRVLVSMFGRSVYINTPTFKKVVISNQHRLSSRAE